MTSHPPPNAVAGLSGVSPRAAEATAPARIDLSGGILAACPASRLPAGALAVNVAINRRAWARVEASGGGIVVESKDTPLRVEGRDVAEILASGWAPVVGHILKALGGETGLHVTTQARVPLGSGLGGSSALAVAVAAAAARALGRDLGPAELLPLVVEAEKQAPGARPSVLDYETAVFGGVRVAYLEAGREASERLPTDPARVEECLLLVDPKASSSSPPGGVFTAENDGDPVVRGLLDRIAGLAAGVHQALASQRYADVGPLLAQEEEARRGLGAGATAPAIDRIVDLVLAGGGAAKVCGGGSGGLVAVWAVPGAREAGVRERVEAALRTAGFPPITFRVDVLGLEVEG